MTLATTDYATVVKLDLHGVSKILSFIGSPKEGSERPPDVTCLDPHQHYSDGTWMWSQGAECACTHSTSPACATCNCFRAGFARTDTPGKKKYFEATPLDLSSPRPSCAFAWTDPGEVLLALSTHDYHFHV